MIKKYVCSIDNSIFSKEEDLIDYIRNRYVTEFVEKKTDVSQIYDLLNEKYTDWAVSVENGEGWYADYIIRLSKDETNIEQHFGNDVSKSRYYHQNNPVNFDDLIKDINWKIETANRIVDRIRNIGEFDDVYCRSFNYGYTSDEHNFIFCYKLKEWDSYEEERYYPWGDNSDEVGFVNSFKKYFVSKLEGEIVSEDDGGYFTGYSINGVNIDGLISRAKKVRFEILEYK